MQCVAPLRAYRALRRGEDGQRRISFSPRTGYSDLPLELPCGQCMGCRLERSRQWATRITHEASGHQHNCFITLTYENTHLPLTAHMLENEVYALPSLRKRDLQLFIKRLRKNYKIRYYACGEYGEERDRPHYHICLFGADFRDGERIEKNLFDSPTLRKVWQKGDVRVGDLNFESAAYVARYCTKKITGAAASKHYQGREPEFAIMSKRPGIAAEWLGKYMKDVYPMGEVITRGKSCRPPRYYEKKFIEQAPENKKIIEDLKYEKMKKVTPEQKTPRQREVKEKMMKAKLNLKRRTL